MTSTEFQLWHTYEIDGDPDDVRTVVSRNVGLTRPGASYVMLARPNGGDDIAIYPVEWDGDGEALLMPNTDTEDVTEDGQLYPYWVNIHECVDVTDSVRTWWH